MANCNDISVYLLTDTQSVIKAIKCYIKIPAGCNDISVEKTCKTMKCNGLGRERVRNKSA